MAGYPVYTYRQRPELIDAAKNLIASVWPEFMLHSKMMEQSWGPLSEEFADFQIVLCDEKGDVIAAGNSLPFAWQAGHQDLPDRGCDAALEKGFEDRKAGRAPNLLAALAVSVAAARQGQGIGSQVIAGIHALAKTYGLQAIVVPVRPSWKDRYPLIPMERYVRWQGGDGGPFDPWLRLHTGLGGQILRVAPESRRVTGTVAEWEAWTQMRFPDSGQYIIPRGLVPVTIDLESDQGQYVEPNVWMLHQVE